MERSIPHRHGRHASTGTTLDAICRAKAVSEVWLRERLGAAPLEITVLRPGIVWGVRSPHTVDIVKRLLNKTAFLVDSGQGIFNGIYIDNLLASIRACCDHPSGVDGFFNVADAELVSWREFFAALAIDLDFELDLLPRVPGDRFPWSKNAAVDYVQSLPLANSLYHRFKDHIPPRLKSALRSQLAGPYEYHRFARSYAKKPQVDREMWHLQKVQHKLPITKFARHFSFAAPVSFPEGISKTVSWLSFWTHQATSALCRTTPDMNTLNSTKKTNVLELRSCRGVGGGPEKTILFSAKELDRREFNISIAYLKSLNDPDFDLHERARQARRRGFHDGGRTLQV